MQANERTGYVLCVRGQPAGTFERYGDAQRAAWGQLRAGALLVGMFVEWSHAPASLLETWVIGSSGLFRWYGGEDALALWLEHGVAA